MVLQHQAPPLPTYLVQHQSVESQTERKHQVEEEQHDPEQRLQDLNKHHNIDADTLKSAKHTCTQA